MMIYAHGGLWCQKSAQAFKWGTAATVGFLLQGGPSHTDLGNHCSHQTAFMKGSLMLGSGQTKEGRHGLQGADRSIISICKFRGQLV